MAEAPLDADVLHLLASNLMLQRRHHEAAVLLERVTSLQPQCVEAYYNLAGALNALGKSDQALGCFDKVLELRPDFVEALVSRGNTLAAARRLDEAELSYRRALELRPDFVEALNNLGNTLKDAGRLDEAELLYRRALELRTDFAEAEYSMGNLLHFEGRLLEAVQCYRRALALKPVLAATHSNLVYALNFDPGYASQEAFGEHLAWGDRHAEPLTRLAGPHYNTPQTERRLRVGYISADFEDHSVAYFFEPVLTHHNRSDFEVWCYYVGEANDGVSERLRLLADHWVDCTRWTDDELAQRIRADQIDILVDLAGHTKGNRLLVFARISAPVQVTYLGYPTSTGLSAINYRITDWQVDPPGAEALNAEVPLRLPHSYFCYRPPKVSPEVGPLPALQAEHVTFGSFNNSAKISEQALEWWAQVLKAVPGAVLLLKARSLDHQGVRQRMRERLAQSGIPAERLVLQGWEGTTASHLALYGRVDIAVDTYPYNGATTTCEALWMGVPVVTLRGPTHASRMGASLLTAVGLEELVAATPERYVEICVEWAADLARLEAVRAGLRDRMLSSALMDEAGFTRALDNEYRRVWRAWCARQTLETAAS